MNLAYSKSRFYTGTIGVYKMEILDATGVLYLKQKVLTQELRTEFIRKSIHILIALVPTLAALLGTGPTIALLGGGIVFYTYAEYERKRGHSIPLITRITRAAARDTDTEGIILGPITLGIGAMISLLLYPEPASVIAIYSLAFGDGISSIAGKLFGRRRISYFQGKTLEGSLACFTVVFYIVYFTAGEVVPSFVIAAVAMLLEAVPVKDLDNIILPMGSGFAASLFLS